VSIGISRIVDPTADIDARQTAVTGVLAAKNRAERPMQALPSSVSNR
jgi:hypothetical protein